MATARKPQVGTGRFSPKQAVEHPWVLADLKGRMEMDEGQLEAVLVFFFVSIGDGLHPNSNGLHPNGDDLHFFFDELMSFGPPPGGSTEILSRPRPGLFVGVLLGSLGGRMGFGTWNLVRSDTRSKDATRGSWPYYQEQGRY